MGWSAFVSETACSSCEYDDLGVWPNICVALRLTTKGKNIHGSGWSLFWGVKNRATLLKSWHLARELRLTGIYLV
jgi:hypothetical protein